MEAPCPDLYVSADVETDGPIPGPFSLLSFALTVVGSFDGHTMQLLEPGSVTLYRELRPISDEFEPEALQVNGLDREQLQRSGADPSVAMEEAARWVRDVAGDHRPVLVAYPVAFDGLDPTRHSTRRARSPSMHVEQDRETRHGFTATSPSAIVAPRPRRRPTRSS